MTMHPEYPLGAPCWVETFQTDPRAAIEFYGPLFGWQFSETEPGAGDLEGEYFVARLDDCDVAGIATLPTNGPPVSVWSTAIRVSNADRMCEIVTTIGGALLLGPLTHPRGGRWAVLGDRASAAVGVWESGDGGGAELVNVARTWTMSTLHTPDFADAATFYGTTFGWETEPAPGSALALCRLPGYVGGKPDQPMPHDVVAVMTAVANEPGEPAVPPHWNVNFAVDDADAIAASAVDLGGNVLLGPIDTPGFRSAVLIDPQGAAFSVSQPVARP